jgi:hypothetical protein
VPLEVRDIPPVTDKSRDMVIQELILEVQAGPISARQVPLLRALLCRFDDRDSALFLTVHHSVCDGWSIQVLLRDLGAFYAARADGTRPKLAERQLAVNDSSRPSSAATSASSGARPALPPDGSGLRGLAMVKLQGLPVLVGVTDGAGQYPPQARGPARNGALVEFVGVEPDSAG